MRPRAERPLAVFLAAAVLAAVGIGVAASRLTHGPPTTAVAGAVTSLPALALSDLEAPTSAPGLELAERGATTATVPSPDEGAPEPSEPAEPQDDAATVGPDSDSDSDSGADPDGSDSTSDAATSSAAGSEPVAEPASEPQPLAPPALPGRGPDSLLPALDLDTVADIAARTGIPPRALAAYAGASLRVQDERPGCHLSWLTLAAVGWIESHHGTLGDREMRDDGFPDRRIIGVPLDGGPDVKAVPDSDGGAWDGDARWDRAVGPMQFIPSTWRRWQVDASGSGTADPQHVDDAALAAARYLCATGGGDLRDAQAWYRAVYAYNNSDAYVRNVLDVANTYAARANGQ